MPTVIEHLKNNLTDGQFSRATANMAKHAKSVRRPYNTIADEECSTFGGAMMRAFVWSKSSEGYEYWNKIFREKTGL